MRICLAVLVLVGCSEAPDVPVVRVNSATAVRAALADAAVAQTPVPRRYKVDGNDLMIIDVPSKDEATGLLETQRCYVWRDNEYRTATITCPADH